MVAKLTAAQAAQEYENGTLPARIIVLDSAANIAAFLDTLEQIALAKKLTAIDFTGSAVMNVTAAQVHNDANALARIKSGYSLVVTDSAANVLAALADLERSALHGHIQSITLTGSGTPMLNLTAKQVQHDVAALLKVTGSLNETVADAHGASALNLDKLQKLAAAGKLASIQITDGTPLTISASQLHLDAKALTKISGPYSLVIRDRAANISASLADLESAAKAGHIQKIVVTDAGSIVMTSKPFFADGDALAKIIAPYSLTVTNVAAANASTVAANSHVSALFVHDSAAHIQAFLPQLESLVGGARANLVGHPASDVL